MKDGPPRFTPSTTRSIAAWLSGSGRRRAAHAQPHQAVEPIGCTVPAASRCRRRRPPARRPVSPSRRRRTRVIFVQMAGDPPSAATAQSRSQPAGSTAPGGKGSNAGERPHKAARRATERRPPPAPAADHPSKPIPASSSTTRHVHSVRLPSSQPDYES